MNLAIVQALALGASVNLIEEQRVIQLGDVQHPFFCGIMENPRAEVDTQEVVRKTSRFLNRNFIWICDSELEGAKRVFPFPEMKMDLCKLVEPKQVEAEIVQIPSDDLDEWKSVVGPTFDFEGKDVDSFAKLYKGNKNFYHMVARVNDVVVGAGTVQILKNIAVLHNITTTDKARGKGIGSRITFELLSLAKSKGCNKSMIHGSKKAEKMYARLGYETTKTVYANLFLVE